MNKPPVTSKQSATEPSTNETPPTLPKTKILDSIVTGPFGSFPYRHNFAFSVYTQCRDAGDPHEVICVWNDWDGETADRLKAAYAELLEERAEQVQGL